LTVPLALLHRDEFVQQFDFNDTQLPAAFLKQGDSVTILITHDEINECPSVEALIDLVRKKVDSIEWT
jgi:hypothetical protein